MSNTGNNYVINTEGITRAGNYTDRQVDAVQLYIMSGKIRREIKEWMEIHYHLSRQELKKYKSSVNKDTGKKLNRKFDSWFVAFEDFDKKLDDVYTKGKLKKMLGFINDGDFVSAVNYIHR